MSGQPRKGNALRNSDLAELYRRPGFMIRRAHQIAVALFLEETGELGITTTQYGILFLLRQQPGIDQVSVAKLLGLDRSTTGMVVQKLDQAGLIGRGIGAHDRRRRSLHLTRAGEAMLTRLAQPAQRAQARILAALGPREQAQFLAMLAKLTGSFNGSTRVPLEARRSAGQAENRARPARTAKARATRRSAKLDTKTRTKAKA
jgi:DNA-binding MarR family transcriptional regulator